MTAPQPHPAWCHLPDCRAYAPPEDDWEFEPYHRSEPVVIHADRGTVLGAFLAEGTDYPGTPHVELVAVPAPLTGPIWQVDDSAVTGMVLPLNSAAILAQVLRRLIRAAVTS